MNVRAKTKGKGFAGVMKRWHFKVIQKERENSLAF